jgi:hypothetical protein
MIDIIIGEPEIRSPIVRNPNCLECEYFRITWNNDFPRSCTIFEFKTRNLPSAEVFNATGERCPSFKLKEGIRNN